MINKVAFVAVLAASLFVTAYAVSPDVRVDTLNMLIETSEVASRLNLVAEEGKKAAAKPVTSEEDLLFGYRLPTVPEGFEEFEREETSRGAWIEYKRGNDESVYIEISSTKGIVIDSEVNELESAERLQIKGHDGMIVEKDKKIQVSWGDTEHGTFISLICVGVDRNTVLTLVNEIDYANN